MKIVIDTNILFSAILNSSGTIGNIIFKSGALFQFYSCAHMRNELHKHWIKLKQISQLDEQRLLIARDVVLARIRFINEELIPSQIWLESERMVAAIDVDDVDFVALTRYLRGNLWTGDKSLHKGLKQAGFMDVYDTSELASLRNHLLGGYS